MSGTASSLEISDPRLVDEPLVSISILVYNHENYLAQTLESVLGQQTGFPFEVLIGEDCSTDRSREIALDYLAKYPQSVRIITADRNVGAFENARRLLRATRGRFIASLDGDDYWLPGKLAAQFSFLHENPECVAVYANAIVIDEAGGRRGVFNDVGARRFTLGALLRRGNFLNSSSLMYRAALKPGLLEMEDELMDYRVHLSIARHGIIGHIGEPFVAYRMASVGSMVANDNAKVRELYWRAIMSVPRDSVSRVELADGIADFLRRVAFRAISTRSPDLFRSWWRRAAEAAPCGRPELALRMAANFARATCKRVVGNVRVRLGLAPNVLYRR